MKAKNCLIFGGSGQIGRNLIRKLTKNNFRVTVVTRNIHQKSYIIKTQANAGFIEIVEANIFDEEKIRNLFKKTDICINLIGILFEQKKGNTFKNIGFNNINISSISLGFYYITFLMDISCYNSNFIVILCKFSY